MFGHFDTIPACDRQTNGVGVGAEFNTIFTANHMYKY